jgi:hypothetical protein
VAGNGPVADDQLRGDLLVGLPFGDQREYLHLASGESVGGTRGLARQRIQVGEVRRSPEPLKDPARHRQLHPRAVLVSQLPVRQSHQHSSARGLIRHLELLKLAARGAQRVQRGSRVAFCEPDTVNVRTGQLLVLARARGLPDQLRATAAEVIRCIVGVPSAAHAGAAGLLALAGEPGDLDAARRALDTVTAIGTWRDDRSYLWSLFVGGMATAAARLGDQALCAQLLAELEPVTSTCGVSGAVVGFVGSNAHWAGIVAGALGRTEQARRWLEQGLAAHRRLGARAWEAESHLELAKADAAGSHAERAAQLAAELGLFGVTRQLSAMPGAAEAKPTHGAGAELRPDGE